MAETTEEPENSAALVDLFRDKSPISNEDELNNNKN